MRQNVLHEAGEDPAKLIRELSGQFVTGGVVVIVRRAILFAGFFILQFSGYSHAQCVSPSGSTAPLYWDANSESDIDHYNVYRSTTSGSGYSVIGTVPQSPDPVSFTDTTPLSTGYYVVTAVDTGGFGSSFSNELCV